MTARDDAMNRAYAAAQRADGQSPSNKPATIKAAARAARKAADEAEKHGENDAAAMAREGAAYAEGLLRAE